MANRTGKAMPSREELQQYFDAMLTTKQIAAIYGVDRSTIYLWSKKTGCLNHRAKPEYRSDYFRKIDTAQKAYTLGFLLGDACIHKDGKVSITISMKDRSVLELFQSEFGGSIRDDFSYDKKAKKFPNSGMKIGNKQLIRDIGMLFGGRLKTDRHIPIIKQEFELFLLQGFFDAEGCICFGHKKNRNQFWAKVSFTSQLKMLTGIQNILLKHGISSKIYPKSGCSCYVIEIRSKKDLANIIDLIYPDRDFIVLQRKYQKAVALRLELGENGGSSKEESMPCQAC